MQSLPSNPYLRLTSDNIWNRNCFGRHFQWFKFDQTSDNLSAASFLAFDIFCFKMNFSLLDIWLFSFSLQFVDVNHQGISWVGIKFLKFCLVHLPFWVTPKIPFLRKSENNTRHNPSQHCHINNIDNNMGTSSHTNLIPTSFPQTTSGGFGDIYSLLLFIYCVHSELLEG